MRGKGLKKRRVSQKRSRASKIVTVRAQRAADTARRLERIKKRAQPTSPDSGMSL